MISLRNKFIRKEADKFVAINLGNCYTKGLIVEGNQVTDYFLEPKKELAATIKKVWSEKKISTKKVKISVKNPSCLVRYFPFPKMEKKRLKQALFYEMNKFIPFPPDKVYFDFFVLEDISSTENLVLLAVAKKDFIDSILDVFEKANLKVSEINLDSICLANLFLSRYGEDKETNSCLLDIGYNFSTMTIVHKGVPFLTRDVKFSAKEVFQIVSRIKNKPLPEIEKQLLSSEDSSEFLKLTQDSIFNFCKEMKSSFDYFEVNKGDLINKLYLSGGLASMEGIDKVFTEALDAGTEVLKPISEKGLKLSETFSSEEFTNFENSFSTLFGLIA